MSWAPYWLNSITSIAIPDAFGISAAIQSERVTIQGGETIGQRAGLYRSSRVMPVTKMVHTVMGGPLPYSTPWYRAPLQLNQVQMNSHIVAGQAGDDVPLTMRA